MSAIGDYVHYRWQNYLYWGNQKIQWDRVNPSKKKKSLTDLNKFYSGHDEAPFINEKAKIFKSIQENRRKLLISMRGPTGLDLKKYSETYNQNIKKYYESIASLQGDDLKNFWQRLVENASGLAQGLTAETLMNMFYFNKDTGRIERKLKENISKQKAVNAAKQKIQDTNGIYKGNVAYIRPLQKKVQEVQAYLEQLPKVGIEGDKVSSDLAEVRKKLNKLLSKNFKKLVQGEENIKEAGNIIAKIHTKEGTKQVKITKLRDLTADGVAEGTLPAAVAKEFIKQLKEITAIIDFAQTESVLNASLAEIMAVVFGPFVEDTAIEKIDKAFKAEMKKSMSEALVGKQSIGSLKEIKSISIHKSALDRATKNDKYIKGDGNFVQINGHTHIQFSSHAYGKADAVITLENDQGLFNASVKAYKLSAKDYVTKDKRTIAANVTLHDGTSLINFLGAYGEDTANHFLNVFAGHWDRKKEGYNGGYQKVRQAANEALVISLLYSGLSGQGLNRTGGFADVLLMVDTSRSVRINSNISVPYTRFLSFSQITKGLNIPNDLIINDYDGSAAIQNISLINYALSTPSERISRLMIQAKTIKLSIGIKNTAMQRLMEYEAKS